MVKIKVNHQKTFSPSGCNRTLKLILRGLGIIVFLYVAFFSIQNFYQGYHDLDIAFNFLNLGMTGDINTNGQHVLLTDTYLRGVKRVTTSFVWLTIDCIFGVLIGYLYRSTK